MNLRKKIYKAASGVSAHDMMANEDDETSQIIGYMGFKWKKGEN